MSKLFILSCRDNKKQGLYENNYRKASVIQVLKLNVYLPNQQIQ